MRVLLVDDTADLRGLMRLFLESSGGFEVVAEAANGREAIDLTDVHHPDLAVVDVAMPVMSGIEAIPEMRRLDPAMRIAVMTVLDLTDLRGLALAAGADICLDKTRPPSDLVAELAALSGVRPGAEPDQAAGAWAAQALRETQAGFNGVFEEAAIGMALTDFDGQPLRVNRALCRILRATREEAMSVPLWQRSHPDAEPAGRVLWDRLVDAVNAVDAVHVSDTPVTPGGPGAFAAPAQAEWCWTRSDDSPVWVSVHAAAVRDGEGRPLYLFCQIQDVSARHRAEMSLRASEARFRGAWEGAASGMSLVTTRGVYLMVNRRHCQMSGYREDELIGRNHTVLSHPDDVDVGREQMRECIAGTRDRYQYEKRWRRKDGSVLWVMISGTVVRDDDGNPLFLASEVRDLSEDRAAREALAASEERYRSLVAALDEGVILMDRALSIVASNASAARILRVPSAALTGRDVTSLALTCVHEDGSLFTLDDYPATMALRSRQVERSLMRLPIGDGSWRWLSVTANPVIAQEDDKVQGVVVSFQDVTATRAASLALAESEARFRLLADNASDLIAVLSPQSIYTYVSPSSRSILGYEPEELLGRSARDLWHADDLARIDAARNPGEAATFTGRVRTKDGRWVWLEVTRRPIVDWATGEVTEYQTASRDITARRVAEQTLAREREFLAALLVNLADGIVACDADGRLTLVNRSAEGLIDPQENVFAADGRTPLAPDETPLARALAGEFVRDVEIVVASPGQGRRTILANGQPILGPEGDKLGAVVALHDVTDRKLLEARLTELAMHDGLTGLANRVLLLDRLQHALARRVTAGNQLAVLFVDLDRFKVVNDAFGHAAGDVVLKGAAGRLQDAIRPADTAARLGGDEFVVVCEDLSGEDEAVAVAERIESALAAPYLIDGGEVVVTASVGIVLTGEPVPVGVLLHRADSAMYEAKKAGRAQHRVYR